MTGRKKRKMSDCKKWPSFGLFLLLISIDDKLEDKVDVWSVMQYLNVTKVD